MLTAPRSDSRVTECNIAVVGAGMSGLAAARQMHLNGIKEIIVLEGSERSGGRIHSPNFGKALVEIGASYINGGSKLNPVFTFAAEKGLLPPRLELLNRRVGTFYTADANIIDKALADKAYDIFVKVDQEAQSQTAHGSKNTSLEEFFSDRLNKELKSFRPDQRPQVLGVFNCLQNYLSYYIGESIQFVSLREYGRLEELPGGDVKLPTGFGKITEAMMADLPKGTVKFHNKVVTVEWNPNQISLKTEKGQIYNCKHAIMTMSLGHLKRFHSSLFRPPLPTTKQLAIGHMGFGRSNKVFLLYKDTFWRLTDCPLRLAWNLPGVDGGSSTGTKPWYEYVTAFDSVTNNPNVLQCRLAGPGAEKMEKLSLDEIAKDLTNVLQRFTGNPEAPKPIKVYRTTWVNDPLFLGSYSYLKTGSDGTEMSSLGEPLPSTQMPRLCFAGEATHQLHFSTVHGAMMSGLREADRITNFIRRQISQT